MSIDKNISLSINSEFTQLRYVLTHKPGLEIDRLTWENKGEFLFEDIPYLPKMQKEHKEFVHELTKQGVIVLELEELLLNALQINDVRKSLINSCCLVNNKPNLTNILFENFSLDRIKDVLLTGITVSELKKELDTNTDLSEYSPETFLIKPLPNIYFTRDIAAVINNSFISCKMHYPIRLHESELAKACIKNHASFSNSQILFEDDNHDGYQTIEGGDIIVINEKSILIGCSERTRSETISIITKKIFSKTKIQRIYEVYIPPKRDYIHLDTVFTIVAPNTILSYPTVINHISEIKRHEPVIDKSSGEIVCTVINENRNFYDILKEELGGHLDIIFTGGDYPIYASREQRNDGTNVLAVKPGTVITYDRNIYTNKALRSRGLNVIEIEGSELVRGFGGPRCMSMPLIREN